jgi:hypothetical protein
MSQTDGTPFQRRFAPQRRQNPGIVRPIYAGVFDLDPDGYEFARTAVLDWVRSNVAVREFLGPLSTAEFEEQRDDVRALSARTPEDDITVVRLQHPEYDLPTKTYDRVRDWRTDITIGRDDTGAWIAARQWFKGVASDFRQCYPPKFIKRLWNEKRLSDGLILSPFPWRIEYPEEVETLVELINDAERTMPIVVLAEGCPLDPDRLAQESIGLAHICRVPRPLREQMNDALRPDQGLAHGAIQTFYPLIPGRPLATPGARWETIVEWRFGQESGPGAFASWLHAEMGRAVVARLLSDPAHRTFEDIRGRQIQAQQAVLQISPEDAVAQRETIALMRSERELHIFEIESLQEQIHELSTRTEDVSSRLAIAESQFGQERTKTIQLENRIIDLQYALARKSGSESIALNAAEVEELIDKQRDPKTVFEAVDMADGLFKTYGTRVVICERAWETAMDSPFLRPRDVLATLIRLGFLWHEAGEGARREQRARELLRCPVALHESQTAMTKHKEERKVTAAAGEDVYLQKHAKLGGGPQNDQTSLTIYFGDRDGEILVGIVGRHLTGANTQ